MKTILIALLVLVAACGDDTSDTKKNNTTNTNNTTNNTTGNNNTNQAVEWSMTGDVEASGSLTTVSTVGGGVTVQLGATGVTLQLSAVGTDITSGTFTTTTDATVQLTTPELSCGNTPGGNTDVEFTLVLDSYDTTTNNAKGSFNGTLPCSRGDLTQATLSGTFDF
ncbi:MAG: hypothetical protein R3E66_11260 [bacterium]